MNSAQLIALGWFSFMLCAGFCNRIVREKFLRREVKPIGHLIGVHGAIFMLYLIPLVILLAGVKP